jgi:catalase
VHRRQLLALSAQLEVLDGIPAPARHGLFAEPATHEAWIRLSNASMHVRPDRVPDIRGFALKVFGVDGESALGGRTQEQDFVLINLPSFRVRDSAPFAGVATAASKGQAAAALYILRTYGPFKFLQQARRGRDSLTWPFSGFATEPFHSAAPIACGAYAVHVRLLPIDRSTTADTSRDWAEDMRRRLSTGTVTYEFQLQFFVDESTTPIEDSSEPWPEAETPYVTVARLKIPPQSTEDAAAREFFARINSASFDPWHALLDHRPLGDVMRARRVVYYASQKERRAGD